VTAFKDMKNVMKAYAKRIEDNANKAVRKVALVIDREVVLQTPVDTGRARANWRVGLNTPVTAARDAFAKGQKGSTASANADAAIAEGQNVIDGRQTGQPIYISNNVEYIGRLNEGSSAQAPAGFVEAAISRGVSAVEGAKLLK
jgi:hypothetical protein